MLNRRLRHRKTLTLSFCLLVMWLVMGVGTTIAWYTDTTTPIRNSFVIGEMSLKVSYKNDLMTDYDPVDAETNVFRDDALYEPGYTQVVYLKIENEGTMDFDYKLSVNLNSYDIATNYYGASLHLPEYLRYGVIFAATEPELERKLAQGYAPEEMEELRLNTYSKVDDVTVPADGERYAALIVYMPEEVGNEANYRGDTVPKVILGLTVYAQQAGAPLE